MYATPSQRAVTMFNSYSICNGLLIAHCTGMAENINNDAEAEPENAEKYTKIEAKKLLNDICNYRDHFSWKSFGIALLFGLIPSGYDTFSDLAFAADDHNSTIELINAADFIITTRFPQTEPMSTPSQTSQTGP